MRVSIGGGTTVSGGDTIMAVGHDPGDTVVGEHRTIEEERHTVDEPIGGGLAVGEGDGSVMSTDEPRTGEGLIGGITVRQKRSVVQWRGQLGVVQLGWLRALRRHRLA